MSYRPFLASVVAAAAACGGHTSAPPTAAPDPDPTPRVDPSPTPSAAAPTPPVLRLPETAKPTRYQATLALDPAATTFDGEIAIDVEIAEASDVLWLNADRLEIRSAELIRDGRTVALTAQPSGGDFLALRAPTRIDAGTARIVIRYQGLLNAAEFRGAAVVADRGERYVYSDFEPDDARRAFPCFDEPAYKVPWKLTLKVRPSHIGLANTPEVSSRVDGDWKIVEFSESPPLPSYLIAFAAGPFELVDAGPPASGAPHRIVVPKGRSASADYSKSVVGDLLTLLEQYTGTPYPYAKLDHIAHPGAGGAMENAGLVTYYESALLIPPAEHSLRREQRVASVTAHEMAHMWFGDLVSPAWWDDLWLNESFASWSESMLMARFRPQWGAVEARAQRRNRALRTDSLASSRKIRQPITSEDDISNAFDDITYGKGSVVLAMLEHWIGEDVFQKAVRLHLERRAHGNASYQDFVAAITDAAGPDARGIVDSFVDQPGAPVLGVTLTCEAGKTPVVALTQSRYAPLGAKTPKDGLWHVPVCMRWGSGKKTGRACTLLREATGSLTLDGAPRCPDWLAPNEDARGYYRAALAGDQVSRLTRNLRALSAAERIALAGDVEAQLATGAATVDQVLDLAASLVRLGDRHSVEAAAILVTNLDDFVATADRPAWERWVSKLFSAKARAAGFTTRKRDSIDDRLLRPTLIKVAAQVGGDATLVAEAKALAMRWLDDERAIDGEVLDIVLAIAAQRGDAALWERLAAEATKSNEVVRRVRLIGLLGQFRDPALARRSLDLVLGDTLPPHETLGIVVGTGGSRATAELGYQFLRDHWDKMASRLPPEAGGGLTFVGTGTCRADARDEIATFFSDRAARRRGGPRLYAQALEQMDICVAFGQAHGAALSAYLRRP